MIDDLEMINTSSKLCDPSFDHLCIRSGRDDLECKITPVVYYLSRQSFYGPSTATRLCRLRVSVGSFEDVNDQS